MCLNRGISNRIGSGSRQKVLSASDGRLAMSGYNFSLDCPQNRD